MLNYSTRLATVIAAGAGALVFSAPIAVSQPQPCAPDDQQCQQQQQLQQGAGIANDVIDNVQNGLGQLPKPERSSGLGIMVLRDGAPWCMPLNQPIPPGAVLTSPTGNGVTSYC